MSKTISADVYYAVTDINQRLLNQLEQLNSLELSGQVDTVWVAAAKAKIMLAFDTAISTLTGASE